MIAVTTCFRKNCYGTWVHPRWKTIHQIDHFITEKANKYCFTVAGNSSPLLDSDNKAIKCKIRVMVPLKKKTTMRERLMSVDYSMLTRSEINEYFCKEVFDNYNTNDSNIPKYTKFANAVKTATTRTTRKRNQPGWFKQAEEELVRIIEKRNAATKAFFNRRNRSNAKSLKTIRKTFKSTIQKAKNNWIEAKRN